MTAYGVSNNNAIAASLGYNPELNQLSKSYCIQLDEDGNVGDHTVTGGGFDDPHDSSVTTISRDDHLIIRKTVHQESKAPVSNTLTTMNSEINYESVAPILADIRFKKNPVSWKVVGKNISWQIRTYILYYWCVFYTLKSGKQLFYKCRIKLKLLVVWAFLMHRKMGRELETGKCVKSWLQKVLDFCCDISQKWLCSINKKDKKGGDTEL